MPEQLDLIERPAITRASARAAAMADANARAQLGMDRAAGKADRVVPGWCETACKALREFAKGHGDKLFTIELARLAIEPKLARVTDKRAWGRVTTMALQRGYIERAPGMFFPAASSNGTPKACFRAGPLAA